MFPGYIQDKRGGREEGAETDRLNPNNQATNHNHIGVLSGLEILWNVFVPVSLYILVPIPYIVMIVDVPHPTTCNFPPYSTTARKERCASEGEKGKELDTIL